MGNQEARIARAALLLLSLLVPLALTHEDLHGWAPEPTALRANSVANKGRELLAGPATCSTSSFADSQVSVCLEHDGRLNILTGGGLTQAQSDAVYSGLTGLSQNDQVMASLRSLEILLEDDTSKTWIYGNYPIVATALYATVVTASSFTLADLQQLVIDLGDPTSSWFRLVAFYW
eukprot:CAMPEP_0182860042 /NCGR_PEP_ID=MMETSP0034_2-20130328/4680_1 /TAXON_ID=156128 /ORGANISM="Nephroselmis pyriformis, Strain CCMP717" /LENGTH=175 /DNA_ID=CAMNT_0024991775 /DNA_START=228 /DNA_END=752 /DNA_ORIENTATION=+